MDRILTARTVITMDPQRPRAEAVAVSGERIVAVGTLDECRAALPGAAVTDTGAAALLPGFIDSHSHPCSAARHDAARVLDRPVVRAHVG